MQFFDQVLNVEEVVVDAPLLDESDLAIGDEIWGVWSKAVS
jgi:hypothetical protein